MRNKCYKVTLLILLVLVGTLLWGCSKPTPSEPELTIPQVQVSPLVSLPKTPLPALVVEPGFAGVQGYMGYRNPQALGKMIIYFCPFTPNDSGVDGIYFLDPSVHPRVIVNEDKWFQSGSIEPGKYVLVVGEEPAVAQAVYDVERPGHTKIFELVEGEILEIAVDDGLVTIPIE